MVMHARKPQRISDGYFDKHQAHPYQKYTSKSERRAAGEYVPSDSHYAPLRSPNGNVLIPGHNHSGHSVHGYHHYTHCAEDRGYVSSRNSYIQKGCVKERDRDYKSSRDKYAGNISPKEKHIKDSEREQCNHERSDTEKRSRTSGVNSSSDNRSNKVNKYLKRKTASAASTNEWSEHISSSGKRYYYNSVSEVSQWEKPREWDSRRTSSKDSSYTNRSNHEKSSSTRTRRDVEKVSKRNTSEKFWNSSNSRDEDGYERIRPKHLYEDGQSLQDMDISPDRSTPFSEESSYRARRSNSAVRTNSENNNTVPPVVVLDNSNTQSGSLLAAALPRIISTSNTTTAPTNNGGTTSPTQESMGTPQRDAGPPTPTHSENVDPHAPPIHLENALPRKMESLGAYSSVVGSSSLHSTPMLTPSLVNYVRPDLTSHVTCWPADMLEKQANKYTEEAYQLGCLQLTRVSAELKCTRSVVRHTEIQATLQEQKLVYSLIFMNSLCGNSLISEVENCKTYCRYNLDNDANM